MAAEETTPGKRKVDGTDEDNEEPQGEKRQKRGQKPKAQLGLLLHAMENMESGGVRWSINSLICLTPLERFRLNG